jgi:nickel superoxide dismutase
MYTSPSMVAATLMLAFVSANRLMAHCQVPCGIYGDERRFEEMLEDTETISKAIGEIGTLADTHDATGHNQLARWVSTKEDHATNIQQIIGQYFLAQRVKPDAANYVEQLKAAHGVIVAAMKCKQAADPATAQALETAILDLYRAYEGKEPQFGEHKPGQAHVPVSLAIDPNEHGHHHAEHGHQHAE